MTMQNCLKIETYLYNLYLTSWSLTKIKFFEIYLDELIFSKDS